MQDRSSRTGCHSRQPACARLALALCLLCCQARASGAISCYQLPQPAVDACQDAGTCDAIDMGDDTSPVTLTLFAIPNTTVTPETYLPPITPTLNTSHFATCFYAILRHIPGQQFPPSPPPAPLPPGSDDDGSDFLNLFGNAPDDGDDGVYDPTPDDDDEAVVGIAQGGALVSETDDVFLTYSGCMFTWEAIKAQLMLLGLPLTMDYYCCNTSGCNYGPDGQAPPAAAPPPVPALPLSSPSLGRGLPPPSSPMVVQGLTQPAVPSGGSGALVAMRVLLALLLVAMVSGGVWFFCRDRLRQQQQQRQQQLTGGSSNAKEVQVVSVQDTEATSLLAGRV